MGYNTDKSSVKEWVKNQYQNQIHRGTQGYGLVSLIDNKIDVKRAVNETFFAIDLHFTESNLILAHHRIPTSSKNKIEQTHPMLVDNKQLKYKYLIMHNGVINNAFELKDKHIEEGFNYTTDHEENGIKKFNDSESLAIEVAKNIDDESKKFYNFAFRGSAAFIGLKIDKETNEPIEMFWGRNDSNPLNMAVSRGKLRLSSEGEGEEVKPFMVYKCSLTTKEIKLTKTKFINAIFVAPKPAIEIKTNPNLPAVNSQYNDKPISQYYDDDEDWRDWKKETQAKYAYDTESEATESELDDLIEYAEGGRDEIMNVFDTFVDGLITKGGVGTYTAEDAIDEIGKILKLMEEEVYKEELAKVT